MRYYKYLEIVAFLTSFIVNDVFIIVCIVYWTGFKEEIKLNEKKNKIVTFFNFCFFSTLLSKFSNLDLSEKGSFVPKDKNIGCSVLTPN